MIRPSLALAMAAAATLACSTKSASSLKTSEMNAQFHATATGNGSTSVSGSLYDSSALLTFVQLTTDDKLTASVGGESKEMKELSLLGMVDYSASFNQDAAETEFHVKLTRVLDAGATDSSARLPAKFTLAALAKSTYSRASDAIQLSWTGDVSADPMSVGVAGECIESYTTNIGSGATSHAIPALALKKRQPSGSSDTVADSCEATLTVTRTRAGSVDKAFKGGSFDGKQVRSAKFTTGP